MLRRVAKKWKKKGNVQRQEEETVKLFLAQQETDDGKEVFIRSQTRVRELRDVRSPNWLIVATD